ncbi:MAG: SpaA isopeptide-forming pilin-related protein [Arcanobacterium sp.]|nr:SpaA isopeptide-forming pilin-related protein [Arcanobacterium sp.]
MVAINPVTGNTQTVVIRRSANVAMWDNDAGNLNYGVYDYATKKFFVGLNGQSRMWEINQKLTTHTLNDLTIRHALSAPINVNDLVYAYGFLWGIDINNSSRFVRINTQTAPMKVDFFTRNIGMPGGTFHGGWLQGNGNLAFVNSTNTSESRIEISITNPASDNPQMSLVSKTSGYSLTNIVDMAGCPGSPTDLQVSISGVQNVPINSTQNWKVSVTNNGPSSSSGHTITFTLPADFQYLKTTWPNGSCIATWNNDTLPLPDVDTVLTCTSREPLAANASTEITITAKETGNSTQPYDLRAAVSTIESDLIQENNSATYRIATTANPTLRCEDVALSTIYTNSKFTGRGIVGKIVSSDKQNSIVLDNPQEIIYLPKTETTALPNTNPIEYLDEAGALAVSATEPNTYYYVGRNFAANGTFVHSSKLFSVNTATGTVKMLSEDTAWQNSNRLAATPDGTIWSLNSISNNGVTENHLFSWHPIKDAGKAPKDYGNLIVGPGFGSGDIVFDGRDNFYLLVSRNLGVDVTDGIYGGLYTISLSDLQSGKTQLTKIGDITGAESTVRYLYSGIAFAGDGTLYVSAIDDQDPASNYIFTLDQATGRVNLVNKFSSSVNNNPIGLYGDLASCAAPKAELELEKKVEIVNNEKNEPELEYTLTVRNTGQISASGVQLEDLIPEQLTYVPNTTQRLTKIEVGADGTITPLPETRWENIADDADGTFPFAHFANMRSTTTSPAFESVVAANDIAVIRFRAKPNQNAITNPNICNQASAKFIGMDNNQPLISDNPNTPEGLDETCITVGKVITVEKLGLNCDANLPTCALSGAKFALYDADPRTVTAKPVTPELSGKTDTSGTKITGAFVTPTLTFGKEYWLVETQAPTGHELLADAVHFSVTAQGIRIHNPSALSRIDADGDIFTIEILDPTPVSLPLVGGSGIIPYIWSASILFAIAAFWFFRNANREGRYSKITS